MSATRCPSCAAAVRQDDPWCTLCFADLRAPVPALQTVPAEPVAESAYSPPPAPEVAVDPDDPLGAAEPTSEPLPRWSCTGCASTNSYDDLVCDTCGRALLEDDRPALPSLIKTGSSGSKAAFIFGGMVLVMAVLLGAFFLIGSFL